MYRCIAMQYYFYFVINSENERPTMKNLNRYVTTRYATNWYNIGIELDIDPDVLDMINKDNLQQSESCFQKTLQQWLKLNTNNATWRTLELALTNVNRAKLKLDPVDSVYGKVVYL